MPITPSHSRSFSLTTKEMKLVHYGLELWGALTCLEQGQYLDRLSKNCLDTLSRLGTRISGSHHHTWPRHIEQIDHLINTLGKTNPKWAKALIYHYTQPGNLRQKACQCGMAKSTFHEQLQKAEGWIGQSMRQLH